MTTRRPAFGTVARPFVVVGLLWMIGSCGPARPERVGNPDLDADVRVSPTPAVMRGSRVTIAAEDRGTPLSGAGVRVRVERDKSVEEPEPAQWIEAPATGATVGTYGPVEFDFPTPGAWWVVVELRAADGRQATLRHPLSVVGPTSEVGR